VGEHLDGAAAYDDGGQPEVGRDENDRDPDRLLEALEEDAAEEGEQGEGDDDLLALERMLEEGVLDEVGGGVGRREGRIRLPRSR